jgi:hypothetical protein
MADFWSAQLCRSGLSFIAQQSVYRPASGSSRLRKNVCRNSWKQPAAQATQRRLGVPDSWYIGGMDRTIKPLNNTCTGLLFSDGAKLNASVPSGRNHGRLRIEPCTLGMRRPLQLDFRSLTYRSMSTSERWRSHLVRANNDIMTSSACVRDNVIGMQHICFSRFNARVGRCSLVVGVERKQSNQSWSVDCVIRDVDA